MYVCLLFSTFLYRELNLQLFLLLHSLIESSSMFYSLSSSINNKSTTNNSFEFQATNKTKQNSFDIKANTNGAFIFTGKLWIHPNTLCPRHKLTHTKPYLPNTARLEYEVGLSVPS
eukprot:GHVL01025138.1.p1 GENE.GHVL01025138.1~~GHVL01025138.1.p1  ORF type:complete len:116 (-),score=3.21 GHVL01025138.1:345-692(-)